MYHHSNTNNYYCQQYIVVVMIIKMYSQVSRSQIMKVLKPGDQVEAGRRRVRVAEAAY